MRLVTAIHRDREFTGAWLDGDTVVLDLGHAAREAGENERLFADMQTMISSGPRAWDLARELILRRSDQCVVPTASCRLKG